MSPGLPKLSPTLRQELDKIEPSVFAPGVLLYPCSARLKDGVDIACVYFVEAATFRRLFSFEEPQAMPGLRWISPDAIAAITPNPNRLPAAFANEIYSVSDAGWGARKFALVFSWWCRRDYLVGGFVDFLEYPLGRGSSDVRKVILYGTKRSVRRVPETLWCVFSG
jgi:hypothetical protein